MPGPALAVFVITARCLPAIAIRNFVKIKVYYLQDLGPHSKVLGREKAGESGSGFTGVERGGLGSTGSLFIGEFQTYEQEFKV